MKNVTPKIGGYAFTSESQVIGVDDNSVFGASGKLTVDAEIITYGSKSDYNLFKDPNIVDPPWEYFVEINERYMTNDEYTSEGSRVCVWTWNNIDSVWTPREDHLLDKDYFKGAAAVARDYGEGQTFEILGHEGMLLGYWRANEIKAGWSDHIGDTEYGKWIKYGPGDDHPIIGLHLSGSPSSYLRSDGDMEEITPSSTILVKPSLRELVRGVDDTIPADHEDGAISMFVDAYVLVDKVGYFTQDEDKSIEDALVSITRRAGGNATCADYANDGVFASGIHEAVGVTQMGGLHKNFIAEFEMPTLQDGERIGVAFRGSGTFYDIEYNPAIYNGSNDIPFYLLAFHRESVVHTVELFSSLNGELTPIEIVPLSLPSNGTVKVSVKDNLFSVWLNGRFVHTFESSSIVNGESFAFYSSQSSGYKIHLSELDYLLPDIIVGVRGNGMFQYFIPPGKVF